jgi:dUTP pyrophosphatase
MLLKIFIDNKDVELKNKYIEFANNHNNKLLNNQLDAGVDLFTPHNLSSSECVNKVDLNIICAAQMNLDNGKQYNTGYYMYPRSSLSKTPLRLANSVGIIDAGYRGHLIGMFDLITSDRYIINKYDRLLQICAPGLVPIVINIVDNIGDLGEETERGDGGFGSTGR